MSIRTGDACIALLEIEVSVTILARAGGLDVASALL